MVISKTRMKRILILVICLIVFGCKGNAKAPIKRLVTAQTRSRVTNIDEKKEPVRYVEKESKPYEATWLQIAYIKGHFVVFKYPVYNSFTVDKVRVHDFSMVFTTSTDGLFVENIEKIEEDPSNGIYCLDRYKFQWFDKAKHIAKWDLNMSGSYLYVDSAFNTFPIVKYSEKLDTYITYIPENLGDKNYQYNRKPHYAYINVLKYKGINILERYCVNKEKDNSNKNEIQNRFYVITTQKDTVELKKPILEYDYKGRHYKRQITYCPAIRILRGRKGNLIWIFGEPGDVSPTYEGIYDINGNLLAFKYYQDAGIDPVKLIMSKGNIEDELKKCGITDIDKQKDDKNTPITELDEHYEW